MRRVPTADTVVDDHDRHVRYLLGLLPEVENRRLDESSVVDDDVAARLRVVEDDLVDAYVSGQLAPELREPFEQHYLSSPRRRRNVQFARSLLDAVDRAAAAPLDRRRALHPRSAPLRLRRVRALAAVAAVLAVAVGAALFEAARVRQTSRSVPTSVGLASEPQVLLLPQTRAGETVPTVVIPASAETVAVQLRLESNDFRSYQVTLTDLVSSRIAWRSDAVVAPTGTAAPSIAFRVPARRLKPQHYSFVLAGQRAGTPETIASYTFQIVRPD